MAAFALIVGLAIGWIFGALQTESPRPDSSALSVATTLASQPAVTVFSSTSTVTADNDQAPDSTVSRPVRVLPPVNRPEVEPMPGAVVLEGEVALTRAFASDGSTLYIFRPGGTLVRREEVPLSPGDFEYPMLITSGRLAFVGSDGAFILDVDLLDRPESLGGARYLVPGARPGLIWVVGDTWVAPLDVETGRVGTRSEIAEEFSWVITGLADGLAVIPLDEEAYGPSAYWTPTSGLEAIELTNPTQSGIRTAANDVAVVVSPGVIRVLNLESNEYLSSFPIEVGEGLVVEVCLSPDRQYVAVVGSTGEAMIVATSDGTVLQLLREVSTWNGIGWTSSEQFVYIANLPGGTLLQALNVLTGETQAVASLEVVGGWWLAAGGAMC